MNVTERTFQSLRDPGNAAFISRLIPWEDPSRILGVRKPEIVRTGRSLSDRQKKLFLNEHVHAYLEEDLLHVWLLNQIRDADLAWKEMERFLPSVTSWAISDGIVFSRLPDEILLTFAESYLHRKESYARRLALLWILKRALKRPDAARWLEAAADCPEEEKQLVNMKGWLFCEALIQRPDLAWPYVKKERLSVPVRLTIISKSIGSRRICAEDKEQLRKIRRNLRSKKSCTRFDREQ